MLVVLGLDVEVTLANPWHFKDCDQAVALLKNIDRRECPGARSSAAQPVALQARFERPLEVKQRIKRVVASNHDTSPLVTADRRAPGKRTRQQPTGCSGFRWCDNAGYQAVNDNAVMQRARQHLRPLRCPY